MKTQSHRKILVTGAIIALFIGLIPVMRSFPVDSKAAEGYLYMYSDDRVLSTSETPLVRLRGMGSTRIDFTIWKFDPAVHYKKYGSLSSCAEVIPQDATLIRRFSEYPRPKKAGGEFSMNVRISSEGKGGYLIKARDSEGRESREWFLVTDLGLVTKQGREELLVYAHTFSEDAPSEGAGIIVYDENRKVIAEGTTDHNGVFVLEAAGVPRGGISVLGTREDGKGASFAQVSSWRYWEDARYKVYIYTDRPIYRPSQKVSLKAFFVKMPVGFLRFWMKKKSQLRSETQRMHAYIRQTRRLTSMARSLRAHFRG